MSANADGETETCLYTILGVEPTATPAAIAKAYRQAALKNHPDRVGAKGEQAMQQINFAYNVLKDESKREFYDETGKVDQATLTEADTLGSFMNAWLQKLTHDDVEVYLQKHRGSDEERQEIMDAYAEHDGDFLKLKEDVHFREHVVAEEDRVCAVVQEEIDAGRLQATARWEATKITPARKETPEYKRRWALRMQEAKRAQLEKARREQEMQAGGKGKKGTKRERMVMQCLKHMMAKEYGGILQGLTQRFEAGAEGGEMPDLPLPLPRKRRVVKKKAQKAAAAEEGGAEAAAVAPKAQKKKVVVRRVVRKAKAKDAADAGSSKVAPPAKRRRTA